MKYCHSCGAPQTVHEFNEASENLCSHCTNDRGELKPREEVKRGIAMWLTSWQQDLDRDRALVRAGHYMQAMPAWADE